MSLMDFLHFLHIGKEVFGGERNLTEEKLEAKEGARLRAEGAKADAAQARADDRFSGERARIAQQPLRPRVQQQIAERARNLPGRER
ncbi:fructose-1-phosphate kinase/fructose-6-phosphate kinase [Burkholderiales bacterium GJ-E10]|nr:fructose-1-phosphate kinase/fructose-6-phosphate kinase [Burkholderiales bacterium GJ-E10]